MSPIQVYEFFTVEHKFIITSHIIATVFPQIFCSYSALVIMQFKYTLPFGIFRQSSHKQIIQKILEEI